MKNKVQEDKVIQEFRRMCEESVEPELFSLVVDKLIPLLQEARHLPSTLKPHCCYIGCKKQAEWQLIHGRSPDDYTESCTEHVGHLLTDTPEIRIYHIRSVKSKLGMYGETPRIIIGQYEICEFMLPPNNCLWIEITGGEGAQITKKSFEPILSRFFKEHM